MSLNESLRSAMLEGIKANLVPKSTVDQQLDLAVIGQLSSAVEQTIEKHYNKVQELTTKIDSKGNRVRRTASEIAANQTLISYHEGRIKYYAEAQGKIKA